MCKVQTPFQTSLYLVTANGDAATQVTSKYLAMNQPSQAKRLKTMPSAPRQARKLPCISIIRSCCWLLEKPLPLHTWSLKQKKELVVYLTTQGHAVYNFINTLLGKMNNCLVNKTTVTILYGNKFSFAMAEKIHKWNFFLKLLSLLSHQTMHTSLFLNLNHLIVLLDVPPISQAGEVHYLSQAHPQPWNQCHTF